VGGRTHFDERVQLSDLDTREVVDVKDKSTSKTISMVILDSLPHAGAARSASSSRTTTPQRSRNESINLLMKLTISTRDLHLDQLESV
jgi:hypothetical protein